MILYLHLSWNYHHNNSSPHTVIIFFLGWELLRSATFKCTLSLTIDTMLYLISPGLLLFFWPCCMVNGILVSQSGMDSMPPAVEMWSLDHWTAKEVPGLITGSLYFFTPYSASGIYQSVLCTYEFSIFLDSTYKWYHIVFVFLYLTYFT